MSDINSGRNMQPGGVYYIPPKARNFAPVINQGGMTDAAVADEITLADEAVEVADVIELQPVVNEEHVLDLTVNEDPIVLDTVVVDEEIALSPAPAPRRRKKPASE